MESNQKLSLKSIFKKYWVIILILSLTLLYFNGILTHTRTLENVHHINDVTFYSYSMKESIFNYHTLPLWSPYYYSGRPLFAQPDHYFLDLNLLYLILFRNIYFAMNLSIISYLFLAGLGMYIFVKHLTNNKISGAIAAIVYMFNGFIHTFVIPGLITNIESYSMIPFIIFFVSKALKSRSWVSYSILASIFLTFQIYSGGAIFFVYTLILIFGYLVFNIIGSNPSKRLLKSLFVGLVLILVFAGLASIKLMPAFDFISQSNRGAGVSYQEYLGNPVKFSDIGYVYISNFFQDPGSATVAIGFIAFLLVLFGLLSFNNRAVLYSAFFVLFSFLLATESFLSKFLFNLPVFGQLRHIERSIIIFAFCAAILAGFGFVNFIKIIKSKIDSKMLIKAIPIVVVVLLILELGLTQNFPKYLDVLEPTDIPIINYLEKDNDVFRIINNAMSTFIGASGYNYLAQIGVSSLKGGGGVWFNRYVEYLSIAQQSDPTKFWGILNTKYILSKDPVNDPKLKFVDEFENCKDNCPIWEAWGPYLYENEDYLPRYYLVKNSVLVLGTDGIAKQSVYGVMVNANFDPRKTVLLQGKEKLNQYSLEQLKNFNAIVLTQGSVDQSSFPLLNSYKESGGRLIPDITEGKNSIPEEELKEILNNAEPYTEIKPSFYSPNKIEFQITGEKGYLVLSETFVNFPGWKVSDKKEIFRANGIITAVYIDKDEKITFKYKPKSFKNGLLISSLTFLLLIVYFVYFFIKKGGRNKD